MTDAQDTLEDRLDQAESILDCLIANDHFDDLSKFVVAGNLDAVRVLIEGAKQEADKLRMQGKSDAPVMRDSLAGNC